jgi:hypothetical protein
MSKTIEEQAEDIMTEARTKVSTLKERADAAAVRQAERIRVEKEWREKTDALRERLEKENGLAEHPRREMLWNKAWEHGHSAGLADVEYYYDDMAELLK